MASGGKVMKAGDTGNRGQGTRDQGTGERDSGTEGLRELGGRLNNRGRRWAILRESKEKRVATKEALTGARLKKILEALEGNWQAEMEGYHTYQTLADRDTDPVRAQVLRHLAERGVGARRAVAWPHHGTGRAGAGVQGQSRAARPIRWPTARAACAWRCGGWRSRKAAISPTTGGS